MSADLADYYKILALLSPKFNNFGAYKNLNTKH